MRKLIFILGLAAMLIGFPVGFDDTLACVNSRCDTCLMEFDGDVEVFFLECNLGFRGVHQFRERIMKFMEREDIRILKVNTIYSSHGDLRAVEIWYTEKKQKGINK